MGIPTIAYFQDWIFYFIEEIIRGKEKFHWATMISNNLHEQFLAVKKTSQFYMTSYLVYLLVDPFPYKGLFVAQSPTPGRELKLYDRHMQLQYQNFKDYYPVNDVFIRHIIKLLVGDFERRVTHSAHAFTHRFRFLFIHFPKFTYIRIEGFSERSYKLPWYPND